jgi:S-disulfanyl-L-cysteine oxidoreductase SoxD
MPFGRARNSRWVAVLAVVAIPVLTVNARSHPERRAFARTTWDSVYSMPQAGRGESAYAKTCARCHGAALGGGDEATPLAGTTFLGNWNGQALSDLQKRIIETMPSDTVGIYDRKLVTDVIAFLLKSNGFPAGAADLTTEPDTLKTITFTVDKKTP